MATPPVIPSPEPLKAGVLLPEDHSHISNDLQASLASLAHKHVTLTYAVIGVLVFVLICGGGGAYFAAKWVDRALARAEKSEELYKADKVVSDKAIADLKTQLATSEAARAADEQKYADLAKQIANNNANAGRKEQEILKPGKTASQAYADLAGEYKLSSPLNIVESPDKTEQELVLRIPDVQQFSATKVDDDNAHVTIGLQTEQITTKQGEITSLNGDLLASKDALTKLQTTDNQCQDALKKYKTVAKVSRFKKILHGAIKGIEIGGALVLGYEIGHKIKF
jgi:hypothetical protein